MAILYWPFLVLLRRVRARRRRRSRVLRCRRARRLALLVAAARSARYTVRLAARLAVQHPTPLAAARGGIRVKPAEARVLDDDRRVGAAGRRARRTASPCCRTSRCSRSSPSGAAPHRSSYVVWPVPDHPDRDQQIIAAMEAERTPAVLYSVTQWPQFPRFESTRRRSSTTWSTTSRPRASSARIRGATSCSGSVRGERRAGGHAAAGAQRPGRASWSARRPRAASAVAGVRRRPLAVPRRHGASSRRRRRRARELVLPLAVPPGARLTTAVGVHPGALGRLPDARGDVPRGGRRRDGRRAHARPAARRRRSRLDRARRAARPLRGAHGRARLLDRRRASGGGGARDGRLRPSAPRPRAGAG